MNLESNILMSSYLKSNFRQTSTHLIWVFLRLVGFNDCQVNNGGCSHLCLFRRVGVKCACPAGMELLADKKSCIGKCFYIYQHHVCHEDLSYLSGLHS